MAHVFDQDPLIAKAGSLVSRRDHIIRLLRRDGRGLPEQRDLVIQPRHFVADEGDRQPAGGKECVVEFPQDETLA